MSARIDEKQRLKMIAEIRQAQLEVAAVIKRSAQITSVIEAVLSEVKSFKPSKPSLKRAGLHAKAEKLKAGPEVLKALKQAEDKSTRDAVEHALALVVKEKSLSPIAKALEAILDADADGAGALKKLRDQVDKLGGELKSVEQFTSRLK